MSVLVLMRRVAFLNYKFIDLCLCAIMGIVSYNLQYILMDEIATETGGCY